MVGTRVANWRQRENLFQSFGAKRNHVRRTVVRCPLTVAVVVIKTLVYADVELGDKVEGTAFLKAHIASAPHPTSSMYQDETNPVACWWSVGWWPDMELATPVSV